MRSSDTASLRQLEDQIEHCAAVLAVSFNLHLRLLSVIESLVYMQLSLQMDSLRLSQNLEDASDLQRSEVEAAIIKSQKEQLELIKSHFHSQVCIFLPLYYRIRALNLILWIQSKQHIGKRYVIAISFNFRSFIHLAIVFSQLPRSFSMGDVT